MWSINRVRDHGEDNSIKSLQYLRTFTIVSAILGLLTLIISIIFYMDLNSIDDLDERKLNCSQLITPQSTANCQFFNTWSLCSSLGITAGIIQLLISVSSATFTALEAKTNIWCSAHALVFVILLPVCILTAASYVNPLNAALIFNQKGYIFIYSTGINVAFCLISIISVPLMYGLEIQRSYMRLECR